MKCERLGMRGFRKVKQFDQHHSAFSAGSTFQTHYSLFKKSCCLRESEAANVYGLLS